MRAVVMNKKKPTKAEKASDPMKDPTTWFDPTGQAETFPTNEEFARNLPHVSIYDLKKWYKAEKIYCAYEIPSLGFMFYIAHYDKDEDVAYRSVWRREGKECG
jgi:hypothetical protein